MGESTVFHANCHKRFDSARLVDVYTYITTIETVSHILASTINFFEKTNGF